MNNNTNPSQTYVHNIRSSWDALFRHASIRTPARALVREHGSCAASEPPHTVEPYGLPAPAVTVASPRQGSSSPHDAFFCGTLSLGIVGAAYAIADDFTTSHLLVASMGCGIAGCIFTLAALSFVHAQGGEYFVILSLLSTAGGTICLMAATQVWVVTALISVCIAGTVGVIWRWRVCTR